MDGFRTVSSYIDGRDTKQIDMMVRLKGGGKRAKAAEDITDAIPQLFEKPTILLTDIPHVQKAITLQSIDIDGWLKSMTIENLEKLLVDAEQVKEGGKLDTHINKFVPFIQEFASLKVACCN